MEVPTGGLSPALTPEEVARRELMEKVGGTATELRYIDHFYTSNGISNEVAYVYLATGGACPDRGSSGSWERLHASRPS